MALPEIPELSPPQAIKPIKPSKPKPRTVPHHPLVWGALKGLGVTVLKCNKVFWFRV